MNKVLFPIKKGNLTQDYNSVGGLDGKTYQQVFGTKSHAGWDIQSFHGDSLLACEDMTCYKVWNTETAPDGVSHGFGARFITDELEDGTQREYLYWHTMSNVVALEGQKVLQGDVVAYEGDSGNVYANGVAVPDAQKGVPPFPGTHLHWAYRLVKKTKEPSAVYVLETIKGNPYKDKDGNMYEILNYENGNRGCLNPATLPIIQYEDLIKPIPPQIIRQVTLLQKVVSILKKLLTYVGFY